MREEEVRKYLAPRHSESVYGIGADPLYEMMDNGELAYVKLGRCRRIERRALIDLVSRELRGGYRE